MFVCLLATLVLASPVGTQSSVSDVVHAASPAVVNVSVFFESRGPSGSSATRVERPSSGVVLGSGGLVLTNAHLVAEVVGANKSDYWLTVTIGRGNELRRSSAG